MATDVEQCRTSPDPSRTWLGQKAKRTQAIPKHSLQGAAMEIFKEDEREEVNNIDVKAYQDEVDQQRLTKQERYKPTLPDYLKKKGPKDAEFEQSKEDLVKKLKDATQARKLLDTLETNSKYFNVGLHDGQQSSKPETKPSWYSNEDLTHSHDINIIGLKDPSNYTNNYNHDKYGRRIATHQYSMLGDPLKTGMEFVDKTSSPKRKISYERARNPDWLPLEAYRKSSHADRSDIAIDLPPNIQHRFGTKVCKSVLGDKLKIEATLHQQQKINDMFYRTNAGRGREYILPTDDIDPLYQDLSQSVRQNIFPGYARDHKTTTNSSVYTKDVHTNRMKDPDQWRCHKDQLSKWVEQDIIRQRMKKLWNESDAAKKS